MKPPLPRSFYERPTDVVARDLLGKLLIHRLPEGRVSGIVVEAEAYLGQNDPGSHAYGGRTRRNAVMFGRAGVAYVYFTYGMHYCFNAVAKPPGQVGAVLIRAVEPLEGLDIMYTKRKRPLDQLTNGPAKLTQAMGIDGAHNGVDLTQDHLYFSEGKRPSKIASGPRIGLSNGADLPLRFWIEGNPFVSRP